MEEHALIIPALPFKVQTSLFGIYTNEDVDSLNWLVLYPFVPRSFETMRRICREAP